MHGKPAQETKIESWATDECGKIKLSLRYESLQPAGGLSKHVLWQIVPFDYLQRDVSIIIYTFRQFRQIQYVVIIRTKNLLVLQVTVVVLVVMVRL